MKKIILLLILIATNSLLAQDNKEQKIDISFSYGLSYIDYSDYSSTSPLNLELPSIGSFYEINFDYHQMNEVMMVLKQYNCSVVSQSAQLFVSLKVGIPTLRLDEVMNKLNDLKGVSYSTTLVV